jgi:hypothetical protein
VGSPRAPAEGLRLWRHLCGEHLCRAGNARLFQTDGLSSSKLSDFVCCGCFILKYRT